MLYEKPADTPSPYELEEFAQLVQELMQLSSCSEMTFYFTETILTLNVILTETSGPSSFTGRPIVRVEVSSQAK